MCTENLIRVYRLKPVFDLNGEASTARTKQISAIIAENAVLQHQVIVLRRKLKASPHEQRPLVLRQLYRWFPWILPVLMIIRPGISMAALAIKVSAVS